MIKTLALAGFLMALAGHSLASSLALGDSLALGFGRASHMHTSARVGKSSCWIAKRVPRKHYDFILISAGTNDEPGPCIERVRSEVNATTVEWVLPVNGARSHVLQVAIAHHDKLLVYTASRSKRVWPHPPRYWNILK